MFNKVNTVKQIQQIENKKTGLQKKGEIVTQVLKT